MTGIALPVESSALLYVNQRLGFTIEFPVEWAGLIQLEEEYDLRTKWRELHHDLSPGDAGEGGPRALFTSTAIPVCGRRTTGQ